ncbi:MAG: hypothetical protein ACR2KT_05290 [Methylocella sp.]|nr:MAG: hypothetical protein DLM68_07435 [Hyphomicrobiales bacterium]
MSQSEEETTRDFLERREIALTNKIASLYGQLAPYEAELAEVRRAKGALGLLARTEQIGTDQPPPRPLDHALPPCGWQSDNSSDVAIEIAMTRHRQSAGSSAEAAMASGVGAAFVQQPPLPLVLSPYQKMTMKEMVIRALTEHFREGATAKKIREFLRDGYGRNIERNNLAPQITRLHKDGFIERTDDGGWKLTNKFEQDEAPSDEGPEGATESPDVGE